MPNRTQRPVLCGRSFKTTVIALAVSAALVAPTHAGFLEDFYSKSGAGANSTPPSIMKTQTLNVISGGGFMLRAPQKNFIPYHITPPSIKAGCGGIDMFMGSFSMANKDQFIAFLRNIGQNAAGLAFKVALNAISPDLNAQMQSIADDLNHWTRQFQNSCALANQALNSSGASAFITDAITEAKGNLLATGQASDAGDANSKVATDGATALQNTRPATTENGVTVETNESNILWDAFKSSRQTDVNGTDLTADEKGMIMALLGTVIIQKDPTTTGTETNFIAITKASIITLADLVSTVDDTNGVKIYTCSDDPCLNPTEGVSQSAPLAVQVYAAATNLSTAIQSRQMPDLADMALVSKTSIPIYKIISTLAQPGNAFSDIAGDLIPQYSQAVAIELASEYVRHAMTAALRAIDLADKTSRKHAFQDARRTLRDRAQKVYENANAESMTIYAKIRAQAAMLEKIEQLQKGLYGNMSAQLAANMRSPHH